ncbi:MAG TPA: undecaprenyl-phosphate glucose phosphotransferase [Candidatus Kapabacteria bacterium]|jgi:putative colanic acid biosynthesis UDP-glucose lipid carrier transferase|nr:undecaprenyl-phosphate glucose phosphotransferase [Candidatus Kapabacteria bacterium]
MNESTARESIANGTPRRVVDHAAEFVDQSVNINQPVRNIPSGNLAGSPPFYSHQKALPGALRSKREPVLRFFEFLADLAILNVLFHVMLVVRFGALVPSSNDLLQGAPWSIYPELEIFMNLLWIVIAILLKLYASQRGRTGLEEIRLAGRAGLLLAGSLLLFVVARGGYNYYSRLFLAYLLVSAPVALVFFRIIVQSTAATVRQQKAPKRNILIIGAGNSGERFYHTVRENPHYGYRVIGFLDDNGIDSKVRPMILGKVPDLDRVATRETVDEVIIALPTASEATIAKLVTECENRCIRVALLPNNMSFGNGFLSGLSAGTGVSHTIEQVGEFALVHMREAPLDLWTNRLAKRSFDIVFSLGILLVIFPVVFLFSALLIKLTSRGPIFFKQERTGEDGRTFTCYKFRTMRTEHSNLADTLQATKNDSRLTTIGRVLRRSSMDELPQFWNVLKGEMSVVGPRPHMLKHTEDYRNIISQYMVRHFVKPGVTGWAQVNGYRGATHRPEQMQRRIEHDLYYIENWSFLLDITLVGRTIVHVIRGDKNAY